MPSVTTQDHREHLSNGHGVPLAPAAYEGAITTRAVLAWLPAVIAFATFVATLAVGLSQLRALQAQHDDVAKRVEAHASAPGHAESMYREQTIEATQAEFRKVLDEHEKADKARDARMDRMDVNILLVCQATRGAACVKP